MEEGLGEHAKVYLARDHYADQVEIGYDFRDLSSGKYRAAFDQIERLISFEGLEQMRQGIRTIRLQTGRPFCRLTAADLIRQFTKTPPDLLAMLSERFHNLRGADGE
ncbi:hypothetical protein A6U89_00005 [Agrobacterium sp. B133/95]|nr:hypothetical protein A6U89_00005 [Agrobacterium sp. B133/95]